MDAPRKARLEKLFAKTLRDAVPVPVGQKDLFIEAICAEEDPVKCIDRLIGSNNGIPSLAAAVRYDCSDTFAKNQATKLLNYLRMPQIELVSGGQYLQKILVALVSPPIFWETLSSAFNKKLLGEEGE